MFRDPSRRGRPARFIQTTPVIYGADRKRNHVSPVGQATLIAQCTESTSYLYAQCNIIDSAGTWLSNAELFNVSVQTL